MASRHHYLGLPPVPSDLKSITSFLQRADELQLQDPVVAYWCAYYAAQQGISLKAQGSENRSFLSALLSVLEKLRATIGPSDAIDSTDVSCSYIEDFALRVFNGADNEDRNGLANRNTAKKFLAAATFIELLKVFDDKKAWESNNDKARYAKWKAADIAKAFREGRTPQAGPAGLLAKEPSPGPPSPPIPSQPPPASPPTSTIDGHHTDHVQSQNPSVVVGHTNHERQSSEPTSGFIHAAAPSPYSPSSLQTEGGDAHTYVALSSPNQPSSPTSSRGSHSREISSSERSIPSHPLSRLHGRAASPTHFVPRDSPPSTQTFVASNGISYSPSTSVFPNQPFKLPSPQVPAIVPQVYASAPPIPPDAQAKPIELTPNVIAKAQKHCRFAISALDYEDAEQARKELRSALALLGEQL